VRQDGQRMKPQLSLLFWKARASLFVRVIPGNNRRYHRNSSRQERSNNSLMRDSLLCDPGARPALRAPLPSIFARFPSIRGFAWLQRLRVYALGRLKCSVFLCGGCALSALCAVIPPAGIFGTRGGGPDDQLDLQSPPALSGRGKRRVIPADPATLPPGKGTTSCTHLSSCRIMFTSCRLPRTLLSSVS
jgi:hypothetical protein